MSSHFKHVAEEALFTPYYVDPQLALIHYSSGGASTVLVYEYAGHKLHVVRHWSSVDPDRLCTSDVFPFFNACNDNNEIQCMLLLILYDIRSKKEDIERW